MAKGRLRAERTNKGDIPKMDLPRLQLEELLEQEKAGRYAIQIPAMTEG